MRARVWATPLAVRRELSGAVDLLERAPDVGRRYAPTTVPALRRLLLPSTRYHVYYVHDSSRRAVLVLAVWSAVRGQGPDRML